MNKGFRLLKFSMKMFSREDLNIDFYESEQTKTDSFSCALIIGENGCGKTELLVNLLRAFCELEDYITRKKSRNKKLIYSLKYYFGGSIYEIQSQNGYIIKKDEQMVNDISKIELPNSFIVQSFSYADRFNFNSEGRYSYLGTRTASNVSYTSHIENSIAEIICTRMHKEGFVDFFKSLLEFLGFEKKVVISFDKKSINQLDKILYSRNNFSDIYLAPTNSKRRMNSVVKNYLFDFELDYAYDRVCKLINKYNMGNEMIQYEINLDNISDYDYKEINEFFIFMRLFSYLRILETPKVIFSKYDLQFSLQFASSGEKQILYSFLNIYSVIKPYSLVIIDEPEISLHPNWQMKYMKTLEKMFYNYTNSHFIIATHSHFMVSDLKKEDSSVIVMTRSLKGINALTYKSDTYSWSAEDILYNVFTVPSSRNYYVASDIEEIIKAITKNEISSEIKNKINNLKKILPNIKDSDPLKKIIIKIIERDLK